MLRKTHIGATLSLTISGNNTLTNPDLVLDNQGTISLFAQNGLRGSYSVAANSEVDLGEVKSYGGSLSGNVFSIVEAGEIKIGDPNVPISITQNSVVSVLDDGGEFEMAFNVTSGNAVVNSISNVTSSLEAAVPGNYSYIAAYSFDVEMGEEDSVRLSFYIGNSSYDITRFSVFYNSGAGWELAGNVNNITYDGEYFSFIVSQFSDYGFVVIDAVPEPSTYALVLGGLALMAVVYRRRKQRC